MRSRFEMGDFLVGLQHQSEKVFYTNFMEDARPMGTTYVGTVEVLLNEEQEEIVYRLEVQSATRDGLYESLAFEELKKGFGFVYGANRHVVLKRFDRFMD